MQHNKDNARYRLGNVMIEDALSPVVMHINILYEGNISKKMKSLQ